jgi:hypothetical protein
MSTIILVAFEVEHDDWEQAQRRLMHALPTPTPDGIQCWWIAEDVRYDRSDNDSAVFVDKGAQREAHDVLAIRGLTAGHNVPSHAPIEA